MTNLGYNPETGEKIEFTWTEWEYEGLLIQLRDDGRQYSIKDFSKVLNEPVVVGGGSSEYPQFTREYCEQMVDALIERHNEWLEANGYC